MEIQAEPQRLQRVCEVACGFEDEPVVAVGIVAVAAAQALVNEQRQIELQRQGRSGFQRRVFLRPQRVVGPVEHEFAALPGRGGRGCNNPFRQVAGQ